MTLVDAGDSVLMLYSYAGFRVMKARKAVWSKERQEQPGGEATASASAVEDVF